MLADIDRVTAPGNFANPHRARLLAPALLAATALSPLMASPALAQDADAGYASDVIIVTAQRREQALEDVPMAVTVVSAATIATGGVTALRDISNITSGVSIGAGGAYPQPAIRGITTIINGSFENNVAVYMDEIYQPQAAGINIDLPNVESVQVLKGPQGTLYGRNATGGAILLTTISPGEYWEGKLEATYARFDDKRLSGYIAGPLSDNVGVSVSGYLRRGDGYIKLASRTVPGETAGNAAPIEQASVRAKVEIDLSDSFRATLGFNYLDLEDSRSNLYTAIENVPPVFALPGGESLPAPLGVAEWDFTPAASATQYEGYLKLELDTGIGTLKSISAYAKVANDTFIDFDGSYVPLTFAGANIKEKTFQQALDFTINAIDNFDLIVGATYFHDKLYFKDDGEQVFYLGPAALGNLNYDPSTPLPLSDYTLFFTSTFDQKKEAWAAYFDATFHASDRLSLNVGGRYSKEDQEVFGFVDSISPASARLPRSAQATFKKFTPRASIRYEIAPRTSIYATYSKGFRSGAFNSSMPANTDPWLPADQESVDAYEVGLKSAGGRFNFELAGFYYDYSNIQVATTLTRPDGSVRVELGNAPSAEIYGVEGNFTWEVFDNFNLYASATYLHARYGDNFIYNSVAVDPTRIGLNANPDPLKTYLNVAQAQDLSGLQMSRSPDFSATAGINYLVPNGEGGLLFAVNAKYTDSHVLTTPAIWCDPSASNGAICAGIPADRQRQQRFRQGNYALVNASVTWTDPSDSYYVRLWGTNLTDHKYRLHYTGNNSYGTYSPQAEPLMYGVTLGVKFDGGGASPPPPMAEAPPPPAPVAPPPVQVTCNKGPYIVFFDWDKSDITPEASTVLDSAVTAYGNCDSVPIMLAGHADRSGGAAYNVGLSERRNGSVRSYLNARGIPDGSISSQAFGESQPRVPTADGVRELQNRRVEITYGPGSGF